MPTSGSKTELYRSDPNPQGRVGLRVRGGAAVDYFERRGTAGDLQLSWKRRGATTRGRGKLAAYGLTDRADADRVGTPIRNEGRYWIRGVLQEQLQHADWALHPHWTRRQGVRVDGEFSRLSDAGFLLEYFRKVQQQEKEQETYVHLRSDVDALAVRLLARWRINDFQDQVERLPEARLDWIHVPLVSDPVWGGLYWDTRLTGGLLRRRASSTSDESSYRAWRGDVQTGLAYKVSLGPVQVRAFGAVRETGWSARQGGDQSTDRFAAEAGWNAATLLWRRFVTPWGIWRHEMVPEVGTFHRWRVTQAPASLLAFDDTERVELADHVFLRFRTRLLADRTLPNGIRRRQKGVDLSLEARYALKTHGEDVGRRWLYLRYDLRLNVLSWATARVRAEQNVNRGSLVDLSVGVEIQPAEPLQLTVNYRELTGLVQVQALGWGFQWRLTPSWQLALEQQYDFISREFLRHRGRVTRFFHRFAFEVTISHDPQQNDTSASVSIAPALG